MKFRYSLLELICFISALSVFVFLNLPRRGHGGTLGIQHEAGFPCTFYKEWSISSNLRADYLILDLALLLGIPYLFARGVEWGVRFWSNLSRERA